MGTELISFLKKWWKSIWRKLLMYVLVGIALAILYGFFLWTMEWAGVLSLLPYNIVVALVAVITLKLVDELMLYEVPTNQVLSKNPTAYAIYILAFAIVIAAAFAGV